MCLCPCLLPCLAVGGYKVNKTADKLFGDKKPQEPSEPAFVTEAKLKWNLATKKSTGGGASTSAAGEAAAAARPKRADRYSSKEQASKQRLAELVEQHKAGSGSFKAPGQQSARR